MEFKKILIASGALILLWLLFFGGNSPGEEIMGSAPIESVYYTVSDRRVHALEGNRPSPSNPERKVVTVVLLHGQAFSAQTWKDIGTLAELDKRGIRAIAIDLPGSGVTGGQPLPSGERGAFLAQLMKELGVKPPVILVSPSMSGSYALPYITDHAGDLAGWIPLAPVGLQAWVDSGKLPSEEARSKLKVVAMYGENDPMRQDYALIEDAFPSTAQFVLIKDAGHPSYRDQPKVWHRELVGFLVNEISV